MEYLDHVRRFEGDDQPLAAELSKLRTLEHVLEWIRHRKIDLATVDLITQDEFCYDFLVPLPGESRWLSFAMT